jgi:hypothetical protein
VITRGWPQGPNDSEAWAGMTDAEQWAYVRRLEDAVIDLSRLNAERRPPRLVAARSVEAEALPGRS